MQRLLKKLPRRKLRALGLFDTVLAFALFVYAIEQGTTIVRDYANSQLATEELHDLDRAAQAGSTWAQQNLTSEITAAATPQQIPIATLKSAGLWSPALSTTTRRHRQIQIWAYAPNADGLVVFAVAVEQVSPPTIPSGDPTTGPTGWISPVHKTILTGPGVSYSIAPLVSAAPATFAAGAAMAVRYLSIAADAAPYLYRAAVPGHPELNQMTTTLDLGGNDLTNGGTITANTLTLSGAIDAAAAKVTGNAQISGAVSAASGTISGTLAATTASVGDAITADTANLGQVSASSGSITTLTTDSLDVTGNAAIDQATISNLSATSLEGNQLTFGTLAATSLPGNQIATPKPSATSGLITNLPTQNCTGCTP
ncbi:shufflon system plasmid conjugative transfer pilus tip adhesin PilV [Thioclava sp. BHET1]|nr:shufflon system plasmid conjugative transfer pilus tip adhesin PilV [Thioclava sp. BHET1]